MVTLYANIGAPHMPKKQTKLTDTQRKELLAYTQQKKRSAAEAKRAIAILSMDEGLASATIITLTGHSRKYAGALQRKYLKHGTDALNDRKSKDPELLLSKQQVEDVGKMLTQQTPRDFEYETSFWTTSILAAVIKQKYNVAYKTKHPLYLLFRKSKFTYHKPDKQYKNRDQKLIDAWHNDRKPLVVAAVKDENTVVLCGDEMMLSSQTTTQKAWIPQGKFPKVEVANARKIRCIYGFLNVKTGVEHAFKTESANSEETCNVLNQIGESYKGQKIMIVWDNAAWHKSALVKEFLTNTKHNFHLINFPPYAPELNPQEHVWKAGRTNVTHNQCIPKIDEAADAFVAWLNSNIFDYRFL